MTDRERLEAIFDRRVFPQVPIEFNLAWDLLNVAQEALANFTTSGAVRSDGPAHEPAALVLFGRLYDDYLGTLHLAGQGLGIQASVVLRSLLNSFYWLAYILGNDEQRERRGREYLASGWNSIRRDFPKAEKEGVEIDATLRAHVEQQAAVFPDVYPRAPERLAREAGLGWHYEQAYAPLSAIEHGEAKNFVLRLADGGSVRIGPLQDRWLLQTVRLAFSDFCAAARLFCELFELGYERQLDRLFDRAIEQGWGACTARRK